MTRWRSASKALSGSGGGFGRGDDGREEEGLEVEVGVEEVAVLEAGGRRGIGTTSCR